MHRLLRPPIVAAVAALAALVGAGVAVAGAVLARIYRPVPPGFEAALAPPSGRRSASWSDWHLAGSITLVLVSAVVLGAVIALRVARSSERRPSRVAITSAAVAMATALVTVFTRALVQWDQLALWAVTTGDEISGYWYAAFDGGVRFVLVGGTEVSPGRYAPALLVHLGAPIIAALAAVTTSVSLARSRGDGGL